MRVAVMQPYLFPYIGYFQLIHATDKFVFLDDVNYIMRGWINRNQVLSTQGTSVYFTVPLANASLNKKIDETEVQRSEYEKWLGKFFKSLEHVYKRAPFYNDIIPLLNQVFDEKTNSISELAKKSIIEVLAYLDLERRIIPSSSGYGNHLLKGADRILDICTKEGCTEYINLPGGRELYSDEEFKTRNVLLRFIEPDSPKIFYKQHKFSFVPNLSILDVLMFNEKEECRRLISQYTLSS
jgi:hypothetical protein